MKVRYKSTVTLPEQVAGKPGEIRELPEELAKPLILDGVAEAVGASDAADKRADSKSRRPTDEGSGGP